ncbi:MAG TPA: FAD-dependent monooxygenase [Candidatus Baltobacterales bacterium]|nr:FAD-dependent monooxygenase [Candidatus Baltobacterales bacterium]
MTRDVEVAIIGGGQDGLATSWYLAQEGVDHVVLEAGRVAETGRSRRWDSFYLVTPNWSVRLPGATYCGPAPDGFMGRAELIEGIGTVIWTAGSRPDYGWVNLPVFDEMGFPIQVDGRSSLPGLYFVGVPWMRKNMSPILYGVADDAEVVAQRMVAERR